MNELFDAYIYAKIVADKCKQNLFDELKNRLAEYIDEDILDGIISVYYKQWDNSLEVVIDMDGVSIMTSAFKEIDKVMGRNGDVCFEDGTITYKINYKMDEYFKSEVLD